MEEFIAKKKYYIHEYSAMQDWFGNRGICLEKGDLKEWCYDGVYLYFTCGNNAPSEITPCEGDDNVMVCVLDSICYECDYEMEYADSPFSNKIAEKSKARIK
jgi:hypothetical protein